MPRFKREQLEELDKNTLIDVVLLMQDHLDELTERVRKLEDQVAKQSQNSSKPPSSDGWLDPRIAWSDKTTGTSKDFGPAAPFWRLVRSRHLKK